MLAESNNKVMQLWPRWIHLTFRWRLVKKFRNAVHLVFLPPERSTIWSTKIILNFIFVGVYTTYSILNHHILEAVGDLTLKVKWKGKKHNTLKCINYLSLSIVVGLFNSRVRGSRWYRCAMDEQSPWHTGTWTCRSSNNFANSTWKIVTIVAYQRIITSKNWEFFVSRNLLSHIMLLWYTSHSPDNIFPPVILVCSPEPHDLLPCWDIKHVSIPVHFTFLSASISFKPCNSIHVYPRITAY